MEFTFTPTPSTAAAAPAPSQTGAAGFTAGSQSSPFNNPFITSNNSNSTNNYSHNDITSTAEFSAITAGGLGTGADQSQYERVSLKKEHGVGDTKQWRKRLINQIEDRIKDKRTSLQNARRPGLQQQQLQNEQQRQQQEARVRDSDGDQERALATGQLLNADMLSTAGSHLGGVTVEGSTTDTPSISEEEERRIVAEVWEAFKSENFEALSQAFHGMSDEEVEGIERDILLHNYTADYDPTYDTMMDMETQDMDQTIDHYMRLETSYNSVPQGDSEMVAALSLSMTLLSGTPCVRCHQGLVVFEPVISPSQSGGTRASCASCGFRLEKEALVYIANTARSHSEGCAGRVQFAFDEETGLLLFCTQCDLLA